MESLSSQFVSRPCNLSDLLPYDTSTKQCQKKELEEYSLLLCAAKDTTVGMLDNRELKETLDPIVGENLCQVRALEIALLADKCVQSFGQIKGEIDAAFNIVKKLLKNPKEAGFNNFKELLKNRIDIKLTESEFLFIQFYLLTAIKVKGSNVRAKKSVTLVNPGLLNYCDSDAMELRKVPQRHEFVCTLSKRFLEKFVSNLQKNVSENSSQLMLNLAIDRKISNIPPIERTEAGLVCRPFYWTTREVLKTALQRKIPIVLWVEQKDDKDQNTIRHVCVTHQSKKKMDKYKPKAPDYRNADTPAIVVKGIAIRNRESNPLTEITYDELAKYNATDLVLAAASKHRQLPTKTLRSASSEAEEDQDIKFHAQLAEQWKCSDKDPSLFFVNHVYCERLGNIKPIKFDVDSYLDEHYADFYYQVDCKEIKRLAVELNLDLKISPQDDSKTITITSPNSKDLDVFMKEANLYIYENNLFHHLVSRSKSNEHCKVLKRNLFSKASRILDFARLHDNPVKFLIDHQFYWNSTSRWPKYREEIINFLCEKASNLDEADVMDIFADGLINGDDFAAIKALGKTLKLPKHKKRATNLLMNASIHSEIEFRGAARRELSQLINEPLVREHFEEMAQTESIMQLSLDLQTYLENMGPYKDLLENGLSNELFTIISDQTRNIELRIVAIRYCAEYFLKVDAENVAFNSPYTIEYRKNYYKHNFQEIKFICQELKYLSKNVQLEDIVRNECKRIIKLIIEHLYAIEKQNSSFNLRKIIVEFYPHHLQLIELLEGPELDDD